MLSLFYIILAILGLSFLIFIHELGHYFMARHVGMHVETFSIGFGKPMYAWERDGVKWQIGWLLFGGYVKIKGTETDGDEDPYEIPDGFFGRPPIDRIKVAVMGPLVNLVFALLIFFVLWGIGGREKPFGEFTTKVGWVDPKSELYELGVRPGDEVVAYDDHPFVSYRDHLYAPMTGSETIAVKGNKVNYQSGEENPFNYDVPIYPHPSGVDKDLTTAGILQSANYIIYDKLPGGKDNPLPEGSPLQGTGITYGDRILWVDGELIYSNVQLSEIINDQRALLTVKRGDKILLARVPRVSVDELRPNLEFRNELEDWQYEAGLSQVGSRELYTIPYNMTYDAVIEEQMRFIDQDKEEEAFPKTLYSELEKPLQPGDQIIAVQGISVKRAFEVLDELQNNRVNIIVKENGESHKKVSWKEADKDFNQDVSWTDLQALALNVGQEGGGFTLGKLKLLPPITPKKQSEMTLSQANKAQIAKQMEERKKQIAQIEDPEKRAQVLRLLEEQENKQLLGIPQIQDRKVSYNPNPATLFDHVFTEIWRTLFALFSGALSLKWISGPIGIVHVVHHNWMISIKEAFFWIGAISLNLGILNLLPIPVLDGGTIVFCLFEMVTGKRLKPKTLEKLIIPFALLLIGFFIYLTFNDLGRIFQGW